MSRTDVNMMHTIDVWKIHVLEKRTHYRKTQDHDLHVCICKLRTMMYISHVEEMQSGWFSIISV